MKTVHDYLAGKLSAEELKESIEAYHEDFDALIVERILPQLTSLLTSMRQVIDCKQYQLAIQDLESINLHFQSLAEKGPLPPLEEIPLDESEVDDDFEFEDDADEIEYADGGEEEQTDGN